MMTSLHPVRAIQLRSIRNKPALRIGLYRAPSLQVSATSKNEQQEYTTPSSNNETSLLARITARVLISIPIAAVILGLTPRKVSAATAADDFSAVNGALEAAVMDYKTGMPHKWLYSDDKNWSHSEYDTIYRFYTEGLPSLQQQPQKTSQQQPPVVQQQQQSLAPSSSSSTTSSPSKIGVVPVKSNPSFSSTTAAKKEQKSAFLETSNIATPSAGVGAEKKIAMAAEVEQVIQPGKVAVMVEAINKKIESIRQQQSSVEKPQVVDGGGATAAAAAAMKKISETSESILTSANAFRVAVGQSIISQVNDMRSFIATKTAAATKIASTDERKIQKPAPSSPAAAKKSQAEADDSLTVAELKSRMSGIATRSVSTVAEGANTLATAVTSVAGRGASVVVEGVNTAATTAVDVAGRSTNAVIHGSGALFSGTSGAVTHAAALAGRGASAVADGASTAAAAASHQAADLLTRTQTFSNTLGTAVLSQASEFKKAASSALQSTKQAAAATAAKSSDIKNKSAAKSTTRAVAAAAAAAPSAPKMIVEAKKATARATKTTTPESGGSGNSSAAASAAAATAAQQAGVLLGKADALKNTLGGAVLSQASNFGNAANDALQSTKKAITSSRHAASTTPAPAAAAIVDKKKDAKPVKASSAVSTPTNKLIFFSSSAVKPAEAPQAAKKQAEPKQPPQQQEKQASVELLARAEAFRQTLGHAVLSQVSAFRQAAIDAKNAMPAFSSNTAAGASSSSATKQQSTKASPKQSQSVSTSATTTTSKASVDVSSLSKVSGLAENLRKDVIIMKNALVAAFNWKPTPIAAQNGASTAPNSTTGAASPLWGWANTVVHPIPPAPSPEKTSWFSGGVATGAAGSSAAAWGWAPTTFAPSSSSATAPKNSSAKEKSLPVKTSWFPSTATSTGTSSLWGWNPSTYFASPLTSSSSSSSGGKKSTTAAAAAPAPVFNWAPQNFAPSSSSSKNAVNPQWSWNPTTFPTTPRVALIAAGLIGCAYILGVAWQRVVAASAEKGGNDNNAVPMRAFSSSIYDRDVSDGPGAGAASAATPVIGRSREALIAESQKRINAAKEALAKAEQQKAAAAEQMAKQQQELAKSPDQAAATAPASLSSSSSPQASFSSTTDKQKSKADSFDMFGTIIKSAASVQDWSTPLSTKYDPLQNAIGNGASSFSATSPDLEEGSTKYCPVTEVLQGLSSAPPSGSETASKYDPLSSSIQDIAKNDSWTGPARDRTKKPLREDKYDVVGALFSAIMQQKEPPSRKESKKGYKTSSSVSWDPVAAAFDAAEGWQPPKPRKNTTSSSNSDTSSIGEQDKYDLTASLMAGLHQINPPRMEDGGARWDPVKFLLTSLAANWEPGRSKPISPTYDPAAGMKLAEPSAVRSKYDLVQAVLKIEAPTSAPDAGKNGSGSGGKRAWLMSSLKENVPKLLNWKGREKQEEEEKTRIESDGESSDNYINESSESGAISVSSVSKAIGSDRDDY